MSLAFCWLAAAIWLSAQRQRRSRPPRRGPSLDALRWLAAALVAVAAVVLLGAVRGVILAAVVAPFVAVGVGRLGARVHSSDASGELGRMPLVLDVIAATMRVGQPLEAALVAAAPLAGAHLDAELRRVAGLLRYGADPATAWGSLTAAALAPIGRTACRSAESGIRLARGFELLAAELRDERRAAAVGRAHRAGVWAMAPLGLCFLPAFACLGVLPVIVGIAHDVLNGAGR